MFGAVGAFGEEVEVDMVVDHVDGLVERVVVLAHCRHTVAHPENGQYPEEIQQFGHKGILENVAPRNEHFPHVVRREQHQRVHQRIAVIDTENQASFLGEVLFSMHFKPAVGAARVPVDIRQQKRIPKIRILYFLGHFPIIK